MNELIMGSTSRIAYEFIKHSIENGSFCIPVSRSRNASEFMHHDLIADQINCDFANGIASIEEILKTRSVDRIVYFACSNALRTAPVSEQDKINAEPVRKVIKMVQKHSEGTKLVYISSDFATGVQGNVSEDTTSLTPVDDYGRSKRNGELATRSYDDGYVVRVGNVLGTRRDFLSAVVLGLKQKGEFSAWTNVYNTFTWAGQLMRVLDKLRDYNGKQRIFHAASSDAPMSRYAFCIDFVETIGKDLGFTRDQIKPVRAPFEGDRILQLSTKITKRELGFEPTPIKNEIKQSIDKYRALLP